MELAIHKFLSLALLCGATAASAAPTEGPWEVTVLAEPVISAQSVIHGGSSGQIADLGTLNSNLAGTGAVTTLNRIQFRDAFATGVGAGLQIGYAVSDEFVPFVQLRVSQQQGQNVSFGRVTAAGQLLPTNIMADFDDWNSVQLNVGAKYYASTGVRMRPYLLAYVGVNRSGKLSADLSVPSLQVNLGNNVLLPPATRFDGGLGSGVSYAIAPHTDILFQVGADYVAAERSRSAAFSQLGVASLAVGDQRWALSAVAGISYRF